MNNLLVFRAYACYSMENVYQILVEQIQYSKKSEFTSEN